MVEEVGSTANYKNKESFEIEIMKDAYNTLDENYSIIFE